MIRFSANLITLSTAIPFGGTAVLEGRAPCLLFARFGALIEKVAPSRKLFNMPNNFAYLIRRERQRERKRERNRERERERDAAKLAAKGNQIMQKVSPFPSGRHTCQTVVGGSWRVPRPANFSFFKLLSFGIIIFQRISIIWVETRTHTHTRSLTHTHKILIMKSEWWRATSCCPSPSLAPFASLTKILKFFLLFLCGLGGLRCSL